MSMQVTLEDLVKHPNFKGNKARDLPAIVDKLNEEHGMYSHLTAGVINGKKIQYMINEGYPTERWRAAESDKIKLAKFPARRYRTEPDLPEIDHSKEFVTGRKVWHKRHPVIAVVDDEDDSIDVLYVNEGLRTIEDFDDISYEQPEGAKTHKEAGFYCE